MRPPINSVKHIVQQTFNTILQGNVSKIEIAKTVPVNDLTGLSSEVREGAVIKAVYCELWIIADGMNLGSITAALEKKPASSPTPNAGDMAGLNAYSNKRGLLYCTQGVTGEQNSNPTPFLRQWFKIPKGKQRFALDDQLNLNVFAQLEGATVCGLFIYKEYF